MGRASELSIAFASGLAVGSLIWLLAAVASGCVSKTRNIPADELAVHDITVKIDALTRQRVAMLKAIQERKERDKAEKAR